MVVAPRKYQDMEFETPRNAFLAAGHTVTVCSKDDADLAMGVLGGSTKVDTDISAVNAKDYDAVVFVGGEGASTYFNDSDAHKIASDMNAVGKLVAAICIAPSTLANAGVLQGKRATAFPSEEGNLRAQGAEYTGAPVEVSRNVVTANGPGAASEFADTVLKLLPEKTEGNREE